MITATDIRYALRVLLAAPTFSIVAVTTLALGIGLNVTVFSILNVVLFKPVPVQHATELVWIAGTSADGNRYRVLPYPDLIDFGDARTAVRDVAGMADARVAVRAGGQSLRLTGQVTTGNYFDVLGVAAGAGRTLGPADETPAADRAVTVLSDTTARRLFGTATDAVGKTIELNGQRVTVVGVTPPRFAGVDALRPVDLWVPLSMANQVMTGLGSPLERGTWWLAGIGRLAEGVDRGQAQAVLSGVAAAIAQAHPESHKNVGVALYEFRGTNPEDRSELGALAFLPAVPLAVLLIACANVASLLMARGVGRQREMAIRTALGAGRWQLLRQLLAESLLLALLGGVGSLLLSLWSPELLLRFANADRMAADFTPDGRVILFAAAVSSLTAIAFGLLPAIRISKVAPGRSLRGEPGASSGANAPGTARVQRWLVAGQLALSLVLLVATGTFVRSVAAAGRYVTRLRHRGTRHGIARSEDAALLLRPCSRLRARAADPHQIPSRRTGSNRGAVHPRWRLGRAHQLLPARTARRCRRPAAVYCHQRDRNGFLRNAAATAAPGARAHRRGRADAAASRGRQRGARRPTRAGWRRHRHSRDPRLAHEPAARDRRHCGERARGRVRRSPATGRISAAPRRRG